MDSFPIISGLGVGAVRLGTTPEALLASLGAPEETDDVRNYTTWHYRERTLSLTFEPVRGAWRLTAIDASMPELRLGDARPIGATRDEAEAMARRAGLRDGAWSGDAAGEAWLEYADAGVTFWLNDGRVEEITVEIPEAQREDVDDAKGEPLPPPYVAPRGTPAAKRLTRSRTMHAPSRRMSDRIAVFLLAGASLLLLLLSLGGFQSALAERRAMRAMDGWATTDGRVTQVLRDSTASPHVYHAVVAYDAGGRTHETTDAGDRAPRVGDVRIVRYPPASPELGRVVGDSVGRLRASLLVGAVCVTGALMFALGARLVLRS